MPLARPEAIRQSLLCEEGKAQEKDTGMHSGGLHLLQLRWEPWEHQSQPHPAPLAAEDKKWSLKAFLSQLLPPQCSGFSRHPELVGWAGAWHLTRADGDGNENCDLERRFAKPCSWPGRAGPKSRCYVFFLETWIQFM